MKYYALIILALLSPLMSLSAKDQNMDQEPAMCAKLPMSADGIIRLSKIEVDPAYVENI